MSLRDVLLANESSVPYLVTIFVAVVGWSLVHSVDRIVEAPSVQYCVSRTQGRVRVTIQNLSAGLRFEELKFSLGIIYESGVYS